jgi:hypothetical protein
LVIEAKFGHLMSVEQMSRYRAHQDRELAAKVSGVLLLLVPAGRLEHAGAIMRLVGPSGADGAAPASPITPIALSWDACLDAMDASVSDQPAEPVSAAADIAQLRSLCHALGDGWVSPLESVPDTERTEYLKVVLEQLKDRVPARYTGPLVVRDPDYTRPDIPTASD